MPPAPLRALDGDARADIAVVGGGITGLSTALHLAEAGATVRVLEAEEPGFGASGRNGGQVNPGLKLDPDTVERDFGELGARMNELSGGAPEFVFALIRRHSIACEARQNGTLRAATSAKHAAQVRISAEQWRRRGAPVECLEGEELRRATGTGRYVAAMLDRRGGDLNPLSYTRGLARAALAAGALIHRGTRVLSLRSAGSSWRLGTPRGTVTAQHVVLATNGYTDDLWPGLRRSIVPVWSAIAASAKLPEEVARNILPARQVLYESGLVTVYYRIDAGGRLLMGGRGPMREIDSTRALSHLLRYSGTLWPALKDTDWTHAWSGQVAVTADHYPHVHEPAAGLIMCVGYNGRGVAMATVMGAQLARRALNPAAPFDMPITPLKAIPLHSLWPLGAKAAIISGRVRDSLGV